LAYLLPVRPSLAFDLHELKLLPAKNYYRIRKDIKKIFNQNQQIGVVKIFDSKKEEIRNVRMYNPNIDNMGDIGLRAKKALEEDDLETVGQLMDINQGMLYGEGVSSLILEKLIFAAKEAGA